MGSETAGLNEEQSRTSSWYPVSILLFLDDILHFLFLLILRVSRRHLCIHPIYYPSMTDSKDRSKYCIVRTGVIGGYEACNDGWMGVYGRRVD